MNPHAAPSFLPETTKTFDFKTLVEGLETTHTVRCESIDGTPFFVAADVGRALAMSNIRMEVAKLDDDERGVIRCYTPGGFQPLTAISESGLYTIIVRSDKPNAKPFRSWITREVLPSIRKTGSYSLAPGETMPLPTGFADALALAAKLAMEKAEEMMAHARTAAEKEALAVLAQAKEAEIARLTPTAHVGERAMSVARALHSVVRTSCAGANSQTYERRTFDILLRIDQDK